MKISKILILVVLVVHLVLLIKTQFTDWPEMLLWPYLVTKGWLPYRDIAIAHTPLLVSTLAIYYTLVGVGVMQLKVVTWVLILTTDILLYIIVKKYFESKTALLAIILYIPLQIYYQGNGLWFDLALAPLGLTVYLLVKEKKFVFAGVLWVLAFLTKQTAVWFLPPILFTIYNLQGRPLKAVWEFCKGGTGVVLVFFVILLSMGITDNFWFWAVSFGVFTLPRSTGQISLPSSLQILKAVFPFIPLVFLLKPKKTLFEIAVWTFFLALGTLPRWELFHFQPALPFLALFLSLLYGQYKKQQGFYFASIAFSILVGVLFTRDVVRNWDGGNRFTDSTTIEIARYISGQLEKDDRLVILNYWEHLYALTDTLPANRPWVPHLAWYMELPGIQEKMVSSLEIVRPKYVIFNPYSQYGLSSYAPKLLDSYISQNYTFSTSVEGVQILKQK